MPCTHGRLSVSAVPGAPPVVACRLMNTVVGFGCAFPLTICERCKAEGASSASAAFRKLARRLLQRRITRDHGWDTAPPAGRRVKTLSHCVRMLRHLAGVQVVVKAVIRGVTMGLDPALAMALLTKLEQGRDRLCKLRRAVTRAARQAAKGTGRVRGKARIEWRRDTVNNLIFIHLAPCRHRGQILSETDEPCRTCGGNIIRRRYVFLCEHPLLDGPRRDVNCFRCRLKENGNGREESTAHQHRDPGTQ